MTDFLLFVVLVFAVYRISQVISLDSVFESVRNWLEKKAETSRLGKWLYELSICPYCLGLWFSIPASFVMLGYSDLKLPSWLMLIVYWLGIAGAQAFIQSFMSIEE